ncbi:protein Dok-7 [Anomaloglossus baeobatrachus]|uniref:protein Dok-7 isoform X1 n=1 Tax=Anomaloglossus baeobatrachus TaxID=238106 RepID=UPI003F4FE6DF
MTDSIVVEGQVRLRDGKKWKNRWVLLRKPSPVADCLLMLVYKDKSDRTKGHKEKSSVTLEDICGLDAGLSYEGVNHTMAIICFSQAVMLGFDNKEIMNAWDVRIRYSLGEVHRFHVGVLPGTKLESGPATLHLCNDILVLARDLPPVVIGQWKLSDLRRYGAVANGFVFEGGTRCGYWAGVFFLSCTEGDQISFLFDCIVRGISPTKGPFGLRPVLPDPNLNPAYMEERVAHETLQLEKRLSLLSHHSMGGDDKSLSSSSSDTSHSDASAGSRLTIWADPSSASTSAESHGMAAAKGIHLGEDKAYAEALRASKPPPKPTPSRHLQEIGRQSSSDSGIATGSHSSYSGSFSSYAESLDICHGEEFGSLISLPLAMATDQNLCTCQHPDPHRGTEYQMPASVRHLYDTPRSVLQAAAREPQHKTSDSTLPKDQAQGTQSTSDPKLLLPHVDPKTASLLQENKDSGDETYVDFVPKWTATKGQPQSMEPKGSEVAAAGTSETCEICSPQPGITRALFSACPVCGGLKGATALHPGVVSTTPLQGATSALASTGAHKPHKVPPIVLVTAGAGGYPAEPLVSDRLRSETATYVNIPISPTSKKQLHYMALERQDPSTGIRGGGATRYAQIDIAATETAHKVGSQHAQSREERLQELEQKRKGNQQ